MRAPIIWLTAASLLLVSCSALPTWMGGKVDEKPKLPGERLTVLPSGSSLAPDPTIKDVAPKLPPVTANADWPQHSGVFAAATANLAGGLFGNETSARAGDGNKFTHMLVPRPVVAGGVVFAMDSHGHISAHQADNIDKRLWLSQGVGDSDDEEIIGGGLSVDAGVLYATSGRGVVAAFDAASGKELWRKDLHIPFRSAPRVADGRVLAVTMDNQAYALSTKNGEIVWDHRGINETAGVMNSVSPTISGGSVLVPYSSGEIFALSAVDGKELWSDTLLLAKHTQATELFAGIGGDPVIDGDAVFATSNNGVTAAIHLPSGQRIWQQQTASLNTPWLAGDELFVLTAENVLVDMAKYTGKVRWIAPLARYKDPDQRLKPITWRGPVMVGGNLAMVGSHGEMLLISAVNGATAATVSIPDHIVTAPVIAGGRMYLVGQDATLYMLQ